MKVFFGAAIQGAKNREQRAENNNFIIDTIKSQGYKVYTEHTTGKNYKEAMVKLEKAIGKLPDEELKRRKYVRDKMIEGIEGDIQAAVFEVSVPSLGTGIEIAHAYLRPRMNLKTIPILALYEKDYWPNKLSTMIRGISEQKIPHFKLRDYTNKNDLEQIIINFLKKNGKK
ncbi:MAG: hypothetical protein V5A68_02835 [Candidatus Thermoplasmatota archaeon]